MADGAHVADVHVDVHPDATGFEQELRRELKAMVVNAKTSPDTRDFRRELQEKLKGLGSFDVLVAPNTDGFRRKLEASLSKMTAVGVKVTPDVAGFRAALERELRTPLSVKVDVDTSSAATAGAKIRGEIENALRGGINVDIDADTRNAMAAIAGVRRELATLSDTSINIDVDNTAALTNVTAVRTALAGLTAASVRIDIDTGSSLADLTAVRAMVDLLDGRVVNIRVDVDSAAAIANLAAVQLAVARLDGQVASVRVDVDSTAAVAAMAAISLAVARFATLSPTATITVNIRPPGVGAQLVALHALISSFGGLSPNSAVNISTGSARGAIQALIAVAIAIGPAIIPVAAAATAAIGAIGPAAFAAAAGIGVMALAFSGVFDAVKALGDAQSKAGKTAGQYAQRQQQIAGAQDQVRDAYRGVIEAERNLANAQRDALRAQRDITRAREEAKEALEDLDSSVKNNALSIRQARLDLADAEKELAAVSNLPVNDRRRVEAQLAYDQAAQAIDDLTTRQGRLAKEQEKASKAGVEGSEQVQSAQEKAADAQERVRDAAVALTRAQEQVVASQRNLQATIASTSATGGAAVDTLAQKMAALSPAGQAFAKFLFGIKDQFKQVKAAAEAGLFPGLQRGIEALLPVLPQIALFVGRVATAMGNLGESAGKALASPFWVNFFDYMGQVAGPLLETLGGIIGGLARGFASLLVAFTPFSIQFMRGLAGISQAFADWAAGLAGSNGFNAFIDYVKAEGPKVLKLFGDFVVSVVKLGIAFAPLGNLILKGLVALFDYLAAQSPGHLAAIAGAIGAIALAIFAFTGGPITAVIAAIVAVAAAVVYAYNKFDTFKRVVDTVFGAAKLAVTTFIDAFRRGGDDVQNAGFLGAIERVGQQARRIFDGIKEGVENFVEGFKRGGTEIQQGGFVAYMANLGMVARQVFDWMRDHGIPAIAAFLDWIGPKAVAYVKGTWQVFEFLFSVLNRVFQGITIAFGIAWTVWKAIFTAVVWYVENYMAPIFMWFWRNIIEPVWAGIRFAVDVAWASIQVVFGLIQIGIKFLATWWTWLYENVVRPVWGAIRTAIEAGWNFIRPIFELFANFIQNHVAPRFSAAVDGLASIWGRLSEAARAPIRFIVDTVLNDGLLAAYNFLADKFNVTPKNVRINVPGLTKAAPVSSGGGGAAPKYYARGGPVWGAGTATSDSIPAMLSTGEYVIPAHIVRSIGVNFFDQLIGRKKLPYDTHGEFNYADGGIVAWAKSAWDTVTDPIGALKGKALGLLDGVPGASEMRNLVVGVGKHMIGGVVDYAKEKIAATFFGGGDPGNVGPGPGFTAWPSSPGASRGDSGVWKSILALIRSTGPVSGSFGNSYRHGDPLWHGSGRALDWMGYNQDALAQFFMRRQGQLLEFIHRTNTADYGVTRGRRRNFPTQFPLHRNHIHIAMAGGGLAGRDGGQIPYLFRDQGGHIPPGLSLVDNQTGRDEWMFNDSQMRELVGSRSGGSNSDRALVQVDNMYVTDTGPDAIADELFWRMKTR